MLILVVILVLLLLVILAAGLWLRERRRRRLADERARLAVRNARVLQQFVGQAAEITAGGKEEIQRIKEAQSDEEMEQAVAAVINRWNAGQ